MNTLAARRDEGADILLVLIIERKRRGAQPLAILLIISILFFPACTPELGDANVRAAERSGIDYSFVIWDVDMPAKLPAGETVEIPVTLINNGNKEWIGTNENPYFLSYHWKHPGGRFTSEMFWGERTELPRHVGKGQIITINMIVKTPMQAKYYDLTIDIVHGRGRERSAVSWFEETGWQTHNIRLEVEAK